MFPPQPQYPQPGYQQMPPQPGYPQAVPQPPAYPAQPPQQYAPPAPPQAPLPAGTLDDFFNQPTTAGGPSLKFKDRPIGTAYAGIVARAITNADIRPQTDNEGRPQTYSDGRQRFVMVIPLIVQQTQEFPEGRAAWYCKGQARDELVRAMQEAGAPGGPPEPGATIMVTLVSHRPTPKGTAYQYRVDFRRPDGAAPVAAAQPVPEQAPAPQAPPQPETAPVMSTATGAPVVHQQAIPQPPAPVAPQAPAAPPQQVAPAAPALPQLDQAQQELLARLTNQQAPPAA